jgi:hypothetical protein
MPVPYRDAQDIDELGAAAYLKVEREPGDAGFRGALFVINARGEPLQFTFTRSTTEHSVLWRRGDIVRNATKHIVEALFAACPQAPRVVLCLADEIPWEVFDEDLAVAVPICQVTPGDPPSPDIPAARGETTISWLPMQPSDDSLEMRLFAELSRRGLVVEAFDRAALGLRQAYSVDSGP